ncbi:MAG: hypothetical protein ACRD0J_09835, partial [Acidimicrobiales bacterium]
ADPFRGRAAGDRAGSAAEEVPGPPDGLDQLWREVGAGVAYGVARHGSWWRWRYEARPGRAYRYFQARRAGRLAGAAVTTVREAFGARFAYVLELLAANREAARTLTGALAGAAVEDGAVGAALVALPGSGLHELAGEAGFRLLPAVLEPKALWFGVVPTGATRDPGSLAWSLAWGDLDHI